MKIIASYQAGYFSILPEAGLQQASKSVAYKRSSLHRTLLRGRGGGVPQIPCSNQCKAPERLHFMPTLLAHLTLAPHFQVFQAGWGLAVGQGRSWARAAAGQSISGSTCSPEFSVSGHLCPPKLLSKKHHTSRVPEAPGGSNGRLGKA